MSTLEMDLFAGVVPFVAIAEARSFRAAAQQLGVTPSALSKAMAKLEADLGLLLLHRTSRSVTLTTEGEAFLRQCREAVDRVRAARELASQAQRAPRGLLRVSLPTTLGRLVIMPALPRLLALYPALSVQAVLTDRFVQLTGENVDVAVRIGEIQDSRAVGRRLRTTRWVTAASPAYLARRGTPRSPADLVQHNCLKFVLPNGLLHEWEFVDQAGGHAGKRTGEKAATVAAQGNLVADNGEALVEAAIAGLGLVQAQDFMVASELARGQLVEVLLEHAAPGRHITVLAAPGRSSTPKVRAFMDFTIDLLGR